MLSADLMFSGVTLSVVDFVHQWKEELFFFLVYVSPFRLPIPINLGRDPNSF
jgi:hypothetical protein